MHIVPDLTRPVAPADTGLDALVVVDARTGEVLRWLTEIEADQLIPGLTDATP